MKLGTADPVGTTTQSTSSPLERAVAAAQLALEKSPEVIDYLESRGVDAKTREQWGVGFWHQGVTDYLASQFDPADLFEQQLTGQFFSRIVLPLRDPAGTVRGLVGRKLPSSPHPVRYLYSKTRYFDQSAHVMGLEKAIFSSSGYGVLVEGPFDVLLCHKAGIPAVSCHGTSFTQEQALLMRSVFPALVVMPDGDEQADVLLKYVERYRRDLPEQIVLAQLPKGTDPAGLAFSDPHRLLSLVTRALSL